MIIQINEIIRIKKEYLNERYEGLLFDNKKVVRFLISPNKNNINIEVNKKS